MGPSDYSKVSTEKPPPQWFYRRGSPYFEGLTNYSLEKPLRQYDFPPGMDPMEASFIDGCAIDCAVLHYFSVQWMHNAQCTRHVVHANTNDIHVCICGVRLHLLKCSESEALSRFWATLKRYALHQEQIGLISNILIYASEVSELKPTILCNNNLNAIWIEFENIKISSHSSDCLCSACEKGAQNTQQLFSFIFAIRSYVRAGNFMSNFLFIFVYFVHFL